MIEQLSILQRNNQIRTLGDVAVSYYNEYKLTEEKENEWTWKGVGDNGGLTRKICDTWYYYEAWF